MQSVGQDRVAQPGAQSLDLSASQTCGSAKSIKARSEVDSADIQVPSQMNLSRNEAWSRTTRDRTRGSDWTCILASQYMLV